MTGPEPKRPSLASAVIPKTPKGMAWLHAAINVIVAGALYAGVNFLPIPLALKAGLLGLCSGAIMRWAGALLASVEVTEPT